ncbi:HNH endonuclease signature motif containing protein [Mangrovihabitans endophyticus]|uniref:HNH nuclease domain-containing protein n=1 Tax=Mangrovihabitans endophyticus TaxID=1751298 RepID=A0A8J3C580_9ACTN|nr:HNH endonuclease signature motif containing protein [Mangrovihabitans endophyticus]GGL09930.1 hypothetical protein GCM10012284_50850 [Mangrovihabitans endophyticus]
MTTRWEHAETTALDCAAAPVWPLSDAEVIDALRTVHRAGQALHAATLHLIQQLDTRDVPSTQHATSLANWLRWHLRISAAHARTLVAQAKAVDHRPDLDHALTTARVNAEQVTVIARCLDGLDSDPDVPAALTAEAESALVGWAPELDPVALRHAGERILAHLAPEIAERVEEVALARADKRAERDRYLTLTTIGDGRVRLHGILGTEAAAVITAALDPLCSPRRRTIPGSADPGSADPGSAEPGSADPGSTDPGNADPGSAEPGSADPGSAGPACLADAAAVGAGSVVTDARTPGQRRADALVDICQLALRTTALPENGGDRPQLAVTAPYDVLHQKLGIGTLDTGERLHPTDVRRLACDARILPAVLGGQGQVLDVGRTRRLATGSLRRALVARDHGCAFPHCDRPAQWCDAHHLASWLDGGPTSLDNLVLLCRYHHRLVHREPWRVRLGPGRHPEFLPPPALDPAQHPLRNRYHLRT